MSTNLPAILITGSSTGIGEACAVLLDRSGFLVFAGVRRETDAEKLRGQGSTRLRPLILDVTSPSSIRSAHAAIADCRGDSGLQGLVNNAGIAVAGPLELLSFQDLRGQFDVNVIGLMEVTQSFLPALRAGKGRIVNISSVSGKVALPFLGAYCASKFAVEALSDSLRRELSAWDIFVSVIEPGNVATPIWDKSRHAAGSRIDGTLPEQRTLYEKAMARLIDIAEQGKNKGASPYTVARAVERALTAKRPRTRYPVGRDARLGSLLAKVLPDRLLDHLILKQFG